MSSWHNVHRSPQLRQQTVGFQSLLRQYISGHFPSLDKLMVVVRETLPWASLVVPTIVSACVYWCSSGCWRQRYRHYLPPWIGNTIIPSAIMFRMCVSSVIDSKAVSDSLSREAAVPVCVKVTVIEDMLTKKLTREWWLLWSVAHAC